MRAEGHTPTVASLFMLFVVIVVIVVLGGLAYIFFDIAGGLPLDTAKFGGELL